MFEINHLHSVNQFSLLNSTLEKWMCILLIFESQKLNMWDLRTFSVTAIIAAFHFSKSSIVGQINCKKKTTILSEYYFKTNIAKAVKFLF